MMGRNKVCEMKRGRIAILAATAFVALTVPALGQRRALAMLDQLEAGSWELRARDGAPGNIQRLCVPNGRSFIQLRHPDGNCQRVIVDDRPGEVTVQYTCRGKGYGLTHIRRESSRLVQIEAQGIANGLPFSFTAEARRVGDCGG